MTGAGGLDGLTDEALLQRGVAAARVGDDDEARLCLAELTVRDPDNAEAWLWLAGVEPDPRTKREMFERALELRPDDPQAKIGLERLAAKYGPGILQDEDPGGEMHCTWHPDRVTLLRCSRCGRPMCTSCAVRHPVGMRCKECVRELRSPVYVVAPARAVAAGLVAGALSAVAAAVLLLVGGQLGFFGWLIAFLVGTAIGAGIADAASAVAGGKRGRSVQVAVVAGMVAGVVLLAVAFASLRGGPLQGRLLAAGYVAARPIVLIYLFVAASSAAARLR